MVLRYKIALSENGMYDEPRSRIPVAEKLELLAAHTAAWRDLHTVTVQPEWVASLAEWSSPVAVSGNIIVFTRAACKGVNGEHEAYAHHTPTAPPTGAHIDLLVVRVPSQLCLIDGAQWMIWLPESVYKLCIDAAQDLLIYELCVIWSLPCGPFCQIKPCLLVGTIQFLCARCLPALCTRLSLVIRVVLSYGKVTRIYPPMSLTYV